MERSTGSSRDVRAGRRAWGVVLAAGLLLPVGATGATAGLRAGTDQHDVVGVLRTVVLDDPGHTPTLDEPLVLESSVAVDGSTYALPADEVPDVPSGTTVRLDVDAPAGTTLQAALADLGDPGVEVTVTPVPGSEPVTPVLEALGARRITVVPVYWTSPGSESSQQLRQLAQGAADYWYRQSAGRVSVTGIDVTPWTAIPSPGTSCRDAGSRPAIERAALQATGLAPSTTHHVVVYFPHWDCGWDGAAYINGGLVWVNGTLVPDVLAHELGHNLGLGHANTLRCTVGGVRVTLSVSWSDCTVQEYADIADVMGYAMSGYATGNLTSAFAHHLGLAEVLDTGAVAQGTTRTVDLQPLGAFSGLRAVRTAHPLGTLYTDFRPGVSPDLRQPRWSGLQTHLLRVDGGVPSTYLLDHQPASAFGAPALPVGGSFATAVGGVGHTVKVDSVGATARLTVAVGTSRDSLYVQRVYRDLLGRTPDPSGLQTWTRLLETGTPRTSVADAITSSDEYRGSLIRASYRTYLGREPDETGYYHWLAEMRRGRTIQEMESGFLASPEYYLRAGGTDPAWVTRLYEHVLGRTASAGEVDHWVRQAQTSGRPSVSLGFLLSTEHLTGVVDSYYVALLGRHIDPSGRSTWVSAIQGGARVEGIIAGVVASEEYYGRG